MTLVFLFLFSSALRGGATGALRGSDSGGCSPCRADNECTDTDNCCQDLDGGLCYKPQGCTSGACPSFLDSTFDCPADFAGTQDPWNGLCFCPAITSQRWCGDKSPSPPHTPTPPPSPLATPQPTPFAPMPPTPSGPGIPAQAQCHIWLANEGTCEPLPTPADLARDCLYNGDSRPAFACPTTVGGAIPLPPVPEPGSCDSCFKMTLQLSDGITNLGSRSILVQHKGSSNADFEVSSHGWSQLCPCLCQFQDNLCVNDASECPLSPGGPTTPTCQPDEPGFPGPCHSNLGLNGITYEETDCP